MTTAKLGTVLAAVACLLAGDDPGSVRKSVPVKPAPGETPPALADIGPAPDIALTDQAGRPFALKSLRGKAVLVSFVYTTCNGTCPATTFTLTRVQRALKDAGLWRSKAEIVSVSLDPRRDTPDALTAYARNFGADTAAWHFLTGDPADAAKVVAAWGMWAKLAPSGQLDHPSRVFLVDPAGRQREIYSLEFLKPDAVVRDVRAVLGPG